MKNIFGILLCAGILFSCQGPSAPTISKEEQENQLADEQFEQIDFSQVDELPTFEQCKDSTESDNCFEKNLSKLYSEALKKHTFVIGEPLNDTIKIYLKIENIGKLVFEKTESSEKTRQLLPNLDEILMQETNGFPQVIPAKKQGVDVGTKCVLPLVVNVK